MGSRNILVIDDEADLLDLISYNLKKEGFSVETASDGESALNRLRTMRCDLIILDLMLPGVSGIELCKIIRGDRSTASLPIIMLTAKSDEVDRVLGLEIGADDYVTKPFSPRELIARVKAVLRRTEDRPEPGKLMTAGDLVIDLETYTVMRKGIPVKLSATEFRLLTFLAERRGKILSRDRILDAVWKDESFVEPRTVDVHIRRLRSHIEEDPDNPMYIKTMRGIGYYMDGEL